MSNNIRKILEEIEGEIMDWFYDTVKINFEVEMIQDATDLRKIIEKYLPKVYQEARKEGIEEVEELLPKPYNPSNAVMNREREAENSMLKKIKEAIKKRKENNE